MRRCRRAERLHAILVTSGNAIPSLPASHHHLPLFAVGEATAARARDAGFTQVNSADGDANALAELVARSCDRHAGPLLLASGRGQGEGLAADLRARGFRVHSTSGLCRAQRHPLCRTPRATRSRRADLRRPCSSRRRPRDNVFGCCRPHDCRRRSDLWTHWLSVRPPPWHYSRSPGGGFALPLGQTRTQCSRCCDDRTDRTDRTAA